LLLSQERIGSTYWLGRHPAVYYRADQVVILSLVLSSLKFGHVSTHLFPISNASQHRFTGMVQILNFQCSAWLQGVRWKLFQYHLYVRGN
jgi:hypothetical protein